MFPTFRLLSARQHGGGKEKFKNGGVGKMERREKGGERW